ncbi:MAG: ArdC family protein, partial [Verrucomicrobiales bacterium]|nr:ArdC family protein [Verrucomicrobiales bacterium]
MSERLSFHERVARQFIEQMKTNTAPWQKPWVSGEAWLPYNPISQRRYHGINSLVLMSRE